MENADDKFIPRDFIQNRKRMSHIYQPVMIKALLENDGQATTEEIAKALLAYDQSQVEYYSLRTKTMAGKVLTNNGVVEPVKDGRQITGYHLTETTHTEAQRTALQAMCDEAINSYISKRGEAIRLLQNTHDLRVAESSSLHQKISSDISPRKFYL